MALVFDNKTYRADQRLEESGVYGTFLFQLPVNDYSYVVTLQGRLQQMNFEGAEYKLRDPLFSPFFAPPIETALLPTFLRLRVCRSSRRHTARSLHMEKVQGSQCHHHACALLHALFWGGKAHRGEDRRGDRPFAPPLPPPLHWYHLLTIGAHAQRGLRYLVCQSSL